MAKSLKYLVLFILLITGAAEKLIMSTVSQISISVKNTASVPFDGTCQQCLCYIMIRARDTTSFNCFTNNDTCELFSMPLDTPGVIADKNSKSVFYFFSSTKSSSSSTALWATEVGSSTRSSGELMQFTIKYNQ